MHTDSSLKYTFHPSLLMVLMIILLQWPHHRIYNLCVPTIPNMLIGRFVSKTFPYRFFLLNPFKHLKIRIHSYQHLHRYHAALSRYFPLNPILQASLIFIIILIKNKPLCEQHLHFMRWILIMTSLNEV